MPELVQEKREKLEALARLERSEAGQVLLEDLERDHDRLVKSVETSNSTAELLRLQGELRQNAKIRSKITGAKATLDLLNKKADTRKPGPDRDTR